ncbi:MAG: heparan-alpha-glucosaminide N-acetyltransferase [Pseudomonadota bacterium]
MAVLTAPASPPSYRALWVDVGRGGAIAAMVVYHFAFDLSFLGFVDWGVSTHPAWRAFAAAIASTFLFFVGVSLVYAHEAGIKWRRFWKRWAIIAGCAAAVTIATAIAMPIPIYFGILHAIATFSLMGLVFLSVPPLITIAAALFVFAAPLFLTAQIFSASVFFPLGLAPEAPLSFDYEPVFPWFGATLLGISAAKLLPRGETQMPQGSLTILVWAGRHSLIIYLVHQPILFAVLLAIGSFINPV